jgi:ligand-binding sensor domain-containing protein
MEEDSDVFSIEVDSHQSKRLFAGACSGIYRSLNGGGTWANLDRAVGAPFRTYVVARAPRSANVVFAGTSRGLLQSPDGGTTWRTLSPRTARSIAFDPAIPRRMFVATDRGILRSDDGGIHFRHANQGLGNP